ncbi:hypothetical protein TSAR_014757 [Trichomalopsis sarcophagae]|uniref:Cytochrome P450 n=1 Tax=Trichomalopsis sarcophagae TaxID=543379 RepID=A0A232FKV7_9HYME|nr:hypothetical protein TSAR_014757 [Trichomalopsis sarcophagae]
MPSMLVFVVLAFLLICCFSCLKPKNFPPGPKWLPLIGCVPLFYTLRKKSGFTHLALNELAQQYGPVVGLKLGQQRFIVVSSYDLVKKVLMRDEFNGRPSSFFFRVRSFGKEKGVLFTQGSVWQQQRRFTMRHFKVFGLGGEVMNQRLVSEAQSLVDFLEASGKEGPVPMHTAFDIAVLNSLWTMLAGHRFEYDDHKLNEILAVVHKVFKLTDTVGGVMSHMPFLRFVVPELSGFNELMSNLQKLWGFIGLEIDEHESSLSKDQPRDLIDAFLMEIRAKGVGCEEDSIFDRENLLILCLDLFLAGSKTTTDSLAAFFSFLALNPHWVKELQQHMDAVIGRDRPPTLADMPLLPKIEAFIAEARTKVLASGPAGNTSQHFERYFTGRISDSKILLNFYSANSDKSQWENPEEFQPQRFLDEQGKFRQSTGTMAFSLGKRRCLGESLARNSLFLFFTYVLQHFDMKLAPGYEPPNLNGIDGFLISPTPYYLVLKPRH